MANSGRSSEESASPRPAARLLGLSELSQPGRCAMQRGEGRLCKQGQAREPSALAVLPSTQGHGSARRTPALRSTPALRRTPRDRLLLSCSPHKPPLPGAESHLATRHPEDLINNFCNSGGRRRGEPAAEERSARVGGGPRSGQRLRPRLPIGQDLVGCPGARRGTGGASRRAPAPPPAPAPLLPSPSWAAGVFKVGGQPGELDIREQPAALLRRLLRSA